MEFWDQYGVAIEVFLVYTAGILVYTLLAAACYGFLSRRDMFGNRRNEDAVRSLAVGLGYVAIFPLVSFGFFLLLAASLLFFNPAFEPTRAFTIAMAIVAAVRACAYIHQDTAHELAKLMPLGLLGVFLVLNDYTGMAESFAAMRAILDDVDVVGVFFGIVVLAEYLMRGLYLSGRAAGRAARRRSPAPVPAKPAAAQPAKPTVSFRKA